MVQNRKYFPPNSSTASAIQRPASSLAQRGIVQTVACQICKAVYAPTPSQHTVLRSPADLEQALMSISHFCFRCRRASCPQCWDFVHGICASCDQEVNLPFRKPITPLVGVLPSREPASDPLWTWAEESFSPSTPLVSLHTGRYQAQTQPLPFVPLPLSTTPLPSHLLTSLGDQPAAVSTPVMPAFPPPHEQMTPPPVSNVSLALSEPSLTPATFISESGAALFSEEEQQERFELEHLAQPENTAISAPLLHLPSSPSLASHALPLSVEEEEEDEEDEEVSGPWRSVEQLLTGLFLIVLLTLAVLIVLAELFGNVNDQIARVLHVDIRAEIAYLLQWIGNLLKR